METICRWSAKSLKDVGKQSERLTKDQTRLAAEIKRAKLAGESLGDLKRRYTDVSGKSAKRRRSSRN